MLKPNFQSIISQTNNGCSLLSLILAKLLLSDIYSENVFALSKVTASGIATGGGEGGFGGYNPLLIEPQMTSYIIETVRTKCIIGEALKVIGQNYDKLSLKIVQKAPKWPLQDANFQNFFGEHAPGPPQSRFWHLSCFKITLPEKIRLKKVTKIDAPTLKKFLNTPLT